jgi:hypothetical protein
MTKTAINLIGTAVLAIFALAMNGGHADECKDGDKEYAAAVRVLEKFRGKVEDLDDEGNNGEKKNCTRVISFANP